MIPSDDDRGLDFTAPDRMLDAPSELRTLTVTEPADWRRQILKLHFGACETNPSFENFVFRKKFQNEIVSQRDIARLSRKCYPTERSAAFGEHRANVCRYETRKVVSVLHTAFVSHGANVVSVVECNGSALLHFEHRLHMDRDGFYRLTNVTLSIRGAEFCRLVQCQTARDVAIQRIVRASLVCEHVGNPTAPDHFRQHSGTVADKADRERP